MDWGVLQVWEGMRMHWGVLSARKGLGGYRDGLGCPSSQDGARGEQG